MEHPSKEVLLRFILGAASRPESRQVVRHLLARCPACATTLQQLRREPPLAPPPSPDAYDQAFDRAAAFLRELTSRSDPPRRPTRAIPTVDAEEDRLQSTAASGNAARRPWPFG